MLVEREPASRPLRSSIGSRRISSPFTSSRSNAQRIARVAAVTSDEIEHRKGVVVADDGRAIDHTGPHRQRRNGLDGERGSGPPRS